MFERKTDDFLPKLHLFREKVLHFFSGYEALLKCGALLVRKN